MSDTRLDAGTLRALIADAKAGRDRCVDDDSIWTMQGRIDWLQTKLDGLPPAMTSELATALAEWRKRSECTPASRRLAEAYAAAKERGEL